ncbi:MAG: N-acetylmuramoyl-L-alanine amidase [Opitutaceae bacterium]|nr:N-acetylmuramoyl-L-alanine amidase [Opitutaceae bacterium]
MPRFREFARPTPNLTAGRNACLGVVLHHSVMPFGPALDRLTDPASGVSYHALIDLDGTRCVLAPDDAIAHHAGVSSFRGRDGCNRFMLGVAFAGDTWVEPLTAAQIDSVLEWLQDRWTRHGWTPDWITDHRQVAPGRKNDLCPSEWTRVEGAISGRFGAGGPP